MGGTEPSWAGYSGICPSSSRHASSCWSPDPDTDEETETRAQIFLSTAERTMRFKGGDLHPVRIPDAVLRVEPKGNESLLQALNSVANHWDALFL